ncbi:hypothetical protein BBJ28_00025647, partial [Nothophytophthora sp. Chile5]
AMSAALGARVLFAVMATALMVLRVASYPDFVSQVPNGANVPGAPEIGHVPHDWPERNAFGQDFDDAGREWTQQLCEADSDEDGQTNGQELGDPCCEWSELSDRPPRWTDGVSHPGDPSKTSDPSRWASIRCEAEAGGKSEL